MTWATVSLRKMELKNRINQLESEDLKISQRIQSLARQSSRDEQALQLQNNYQKTLLQQDYQDSMDAISNDGKASDADKQQAIASAQQQYNDRLSIFEQTLENRSNSIKELVDAQTQALEAQQEQVETQLKAARAEYESIGKAMDTDIKSSTITLGSF